MQGNAILIAICWYKMQYFSTAIGGLRGEQADGGSGCWTAQKAAPYCFSLAFGYMDRSVSDALTWVNRFWLDFCCCCWWWPTTLICFTGCAPCLAWIHAGAAHLHPKVCLLTTVFFYYYYFIVTCRSSPYFVCCLSTLDSIAFLFQACRKWSQTLKA